MEIGLGNIIGLPKKKNILPCQDSGAVLARLKFFIRLDRSRIKLWRTTAVSGVRLIVVGLRGCG